MRRLWVTASLDESAQADGHPRWPSSEAPSPLVGGVSPLDPGFLLSDWYGYRGRSALTRPLPAVTTDGPTRLPRGTDKALQVIKHRRLEALHVSRGLRNLVAARIGSKSGHAAGNSIRAIMYHHAEVLVP